MDISDNVIKILGRNFTFVFPMHLRRVIAMGYGILKLSASIAPRSASNFKRRVMGVPLLSGRKTAVLREAHLL